MTLVIEIGDSVYVRKSVGSIEVDVLCYGRDIDGSVSHTFHWLCATCFDNGEMTPSRLSLHDPKPLSDFRFGLVRGIIG